MSGSDRLSSLQDFTHSSAWRPLCKSWATPDNLLSCRAVPRCRTRRSPGQTRMCQGVEMPPGNLGPTPPPGRTSGAGTQRPGTCPELQETEAWAAPSSCLGAAPAPPSRCAGLSPPGGGEGGGSSLGWDFQRGKRRAP